MGVLHKIAAAKAAEESHCKQSRITLVRKRYGNRKRRRCKCLMLLINLLQRIQLAGQQERATASRRTQVGTMETTREGA